MKTRMPSESRSSILLSKEENELIFKLVGSRCQSLATAVVQLFMTEGPAHNQWYKRDTGILCLIKDNQRKSYFFRIFCMQRKAMIWEHEVYTQIEYKNPRPFLHTFEAEDCMIAFNFASDDEAFILKNSLTEKIELRKQKREERRQQRLQNTTRTSGDVSKFSIVVNKAPAITPALPLQPNPPPNIPVNVSPAPITNTHLHNGSSTLMPFQKGFGASYLKSANKKPKGRKITKDDIGLPSDFKHVSHVGWDANKGFDIENLPERDMKDFFLRAGVSESQLRDKDTRDFIYDFIKNHGGVNAVKEALFEDEEETTTNELIPTAQLGRAPMPPPVPARNPNMPVTPLPIVPPVRDTSGSRHAPPPPSRAPPPPPPPSQRQLPPPPQVGAMATPPPPPPPPIPPAAAPMAPPAAPVPPPISGAPPPLPDIRSALMESIRGGKPLKRVEVDRKPVGDDKRGDLLCEIRQGIELRPVSINANNDDRKSTSQAGLAGALARALEERSKAIHSDSSNSDDDTTSDGDEWD
ncbi:actin nucleation-promoting factor WAS-like isoform X2 [Arctopsyche grandis]|uniref:actin nucleation-promoting factor WAS-like isoform X2 n=1 Tax=Arctopsyche grandis TaxID=121162 RepID=UPI00406D7F1E